MNLTLSLCTSILNPPLTQPIPNSQSTTPPPRTASSPKPPQEVEGGISGGAKSARSHLCASIRPALPSFLGRAMSRLVWFGGGEGTRVGRRGKSRKGVRMGSWRGRNLWWGRERRGCEWVGGPGLLGVRGDEVVVVIGGGRGRGAGNGENEAVRG